MELAILLTISGASLLLEGFLWDAAQVCLQGAVRVGETWKKAHGNSVHVSSSP